MYEGVVYFSGPGTKWAKKVDEREIIARHRSPYRFIARTFARAAHGHLDPTRCGYVVLKDGELLEHVEAQPK